jgi:hypothetical protein
MNMPSHKAFVLFAVAVAVLATTQFAHAAGMFADQDVDPRFKAKIMKEKARQNSELAKNFNFTGNAPADAHCGSQNIGNIDTGGRIGAAPREVFVFAPNSTNLVSGKGCK